MRILLDQGTPAPLRRALADHSVATETSFDVFITTDQNVRYQQNLTGRPLAILVLPTTSWPRLQPHAAAIATAVVALRPGELREWSFPD